MVDDEINRENITKTVNVEENSIDSVPLSVLENIVQYFTVNLIECSKNIEKNNTLIGEKLSNMLVLSNFESKFIELMLQNKYYMNGRSAIAYEELKANAKDITLSSLGKIAETDNLKLYEELLAAKAEIAELREAVGQANQENATLQQEKAISQEEAAKADNRVNKAIEGLHSYTILAEWYENMLLEVPKIKKKNSGLIRVQSWENAMECYIYNHPKPKVDTFTFARD